ncbi:YihY/virulence factor BrkB family protein [Noviherbaspirillum pedocola]|uniref:YihY/virulence factor BrkB family protein n=1 Tax=Noviherbaspirillum pedocola TaxID=2801341 RepID=A0A934T0G5_9BURK|nr:YihY/virulence factor BrkB family protein [Noviherbaspirillum pedocola]MBK4735098.1 YihY/virulence factor BrkB family protein [Noviherbaspirillum pedocola]
MMRIPGLRGIGPGEIARRCIQQCVLHDTLTHARAISYQVLFSFFPFLIFFFALLGFLDLANLFDWLRRHSEVFFLRQTAPQINALIDQLEQRHHGMLSLGVAVALWAASSAMRAMMRAMNAVYEVRETRALWKRYAWSIAATLAIGPMLALALTLLLVRPDAMEALVRVFGVDVSLAVLWAWWLRWPVILLLLTATVTVIYWVGPDVQQRFVFVTPGAFLAVLAWFFASLGFDVYVRDIATIGDVYGSIGTIVVLLLYCLFSSLILLFGAELNAAVEYCSPLGKNPGERAPGLHETASEHHPA